MTPLTPSNRGAQAVQLVDSIDVDRQRDHAHLVVLFRHTGGYVNTLAGYKGGHISQQSHPVPCLNPDTNGVEGLRLAPAEIYQAVGVGLVSGSPGRSCAWTATVLSRVHDADDLLSLNRVAARRHPGREVAHSEHLGSRGRAGHPRTCARLLLWSDRVGGEPLHDLRKRLWCRFPRAVKQLRGRVETS